MGGLFDAGDRCDIKGVGVILATGWPQTHPTWGIVICDDNNGAPDTIIRKVSGIEGISGWNWYGFDPPIHEEDGRFWFFYIQEDPFPNCTALFCDTFVDYPEVWYTPPPQGDWCMYVVVDEFTGLEEFRIGPMDMEVTSITSGHFFIKIRSYRSTNAVVTIFEPTGRCVYRKYERIKTGGNTIPININHLPSGPYFLRISTPERSKKARLIIIR